MAIKRKRLVASTVILMAAAAVVIAPGYLMTLQAVGRFVPTLKSSPADFGLVAEVVSFQSLDGIELKGWWIAAQSPPARGTVILAHGRDANRASMLSRAKFLVANGYNGFPIDLRAHGESGGHYMTPGYLEALDILGAVEAAKRRGTEGPFVALGHSYGAVASLGALGRSAELGAAIADGAFISPYRALERATEVVGKDPTASFLQKLSLRTANRLMASNWARRYVQWAFYARSGVWIEVSDADALPAISRVGSKPILFIVGENDVIAPPTDARQMYDAAASAKRALLVIPGAGHNNTYRANPKAYETAALHFLAQIRQPLPASSNEAFVPPINDRPQEQR